MKRLSVVFMVLMLVLGLPMVAVAQDDTPDADVPVVVTDGEQLSDVSINLVQIVIGLLSAFAAGGVIGIAGLMVFIDRLRNDVATVTALEKLSASYPPETRELLLSISGAVKSVGKLGEEIFDDVPVVDKGVIPNG